MSSQHGRTGVEQGATSVEYALTVGLVNLTIIAMAVILGDRAAEYIADVEQVVASLLGV